MMPPRTPPGEPDDLDLILPWRATGRLGPAEAERVEAALARDPDLARRLALAEAERAGTVAVNEALGHPTGAARDALFARIDADLAADARAGSRGWIARLGEALAALSPPALAGLGLAACLVILAQVGLLAGAMLRAPTGPAYETASQGGAGAAGAGTFALVAFAPAATAAQIADGLREVGAVIVDGPRPGGLYRLRLASEPVSPAAAEAILGKLRARPGLVQFAAPEAAPGP
ncbi:hypothetical protein [Methylobacterium durans]|uniref:Uncharacterized protein n=1 Tax=Methylobacterium durans TaxID=2202825 RepID=A0A2U8W5V3_9HYPH|nr:hypothetical protein [Methylobacterium durans]AWN40900.1 hypothetical protein DK389_10660 [Methylobacterium durans]